MSNLDYHLPLELLKRVFPATPVINLRRYFPDVAKAAEQSEANRSLFMVALATIRAETASFLPCEEEISRFNTSPGGNPFDLYDQRKQLGNMGPPDGERFRGRGYVQLTGRANYEYFGPLVQLDLITSPELALVSYPAARILFAFLRRREQKLQRAVEAGDLLTARSLVNGGSHGFEPFRQAFQTLNSLYPAA